jgi:hypothetical protein
MALMTVQEADLAWALTYAVKPHLNTLEHNYVFVTVGAGDTFAAVHQLIKMFAAKQIPLHPRLVMLCRTWLGPYAGHEEYNYLRSLIEGLVPDTITESTTGRRLPSAPKPQPLLTGTLRRPMRRCGPRPARQLGAVR